LAGISAAVLYLVVAKDLEVASWKNKRRKGEWYTLMLRVRKALENMFGDFDLNYYLVLNKELSNCKL